MSEIPKNSFENSKDKNLKLNNFFNLLAGRGKFSDKKVISNSDDNITETEKAILDKIISGGSEKYKTYLGSNLRNVDILELMINDKKFNKKVIDESIITEIDNILNNSKQSLLDLRQDYESGKTEKPQELESSKIQEPELINSKIEGDNSETYSLTKTYTQTDLLDSGVRFLKGIDNKMPENTPDFLDKYNLNRLIYSGDEKVEEGEANHGGVLNIWSHKRSSEMIAAAVYEGLPSSMNSILKSAIGSVVATASAYLKETQDMAICNEDLQIPFFIDLGNNNVIFFTYAPGGTLNLDFKFSDISALNKKAGSFLKYIDGEVIQNKGDSKRKRDEIRVDIGFGGEGWDAKGTSIKSLQTIGNFKDYIKSKYKGDQVNIFTVTDEIIKAKVGSNGEASIKGIGGVQNDKTGTNYIAGAEGKYSLDTNIGTVGLKAGGMKNPNGTGTIVGGEFQLPDNGAKISIDQTSNYVDPKEHVYTNATTIKGDLPLGDSDLSMGVYYSNGTGSYDGRNYGKKGEVIGGKVSFNKNLNPSPSTEILNHRVNLEAGLTNNRYGAGASISNVPSDGDINYGVSAELGKGNKYGINDTGDYISAYIDKDLMNLFNLFKDNNIDEQQKINYLNTLTKKYNLPISTTDIQKLGPINSLRAFAVVNRDIINEDTLINLGFKFKGGKTVLPNDFIDLKNKDNQDFITNFMMNVSIGGKLGVLLSNGKSGESIKFGPELFLKMDILLTENSTLEYLSYIDWTKVLNRASFVRNVYRDDDGTVKGFVLSVENQNFTFGAGIGINTIQKSGIGERLSVSAFNTGGISISWGNHSKIFGDTNSEISLNLGTLLPIISTVITENLGENVTSSEGEVFGNNEDIFQSVVKTEEDRKITTSIYEKLSDLKKYVGFEFKDSFVSKVGSTKNIKYFNGWLEKNKDFIINNKDKIRNISFSYSSETESNYDNSGKILKIGIPLSGNIQLLTYDCFKSEEYDLFLFTDDPEKINKRINFSNKSINYYINYGSNEISKESSKMLNKYLENIEIIGFTLLNDIERKGFTNLLLRFIQNGDIEKMKYKRIIINNYNYSMDYFGSVGVDKGIKSLNLEKRLLANLGKSNIDYSKDFDIEKISNGQITQNDLSQIINKFKDISKKEALIKALIDINKIEIIKDDDNNFDSGGENGEIYLSSSFFESMKNGSKTPDEILEIFTDSKVDYLDELDSEIKEGFTTNEAQIVKVGKNSGEGSFYEFRPTSDIMKSNDGKIKVSYDIFDHGNKKTDSIDVELNTNTDDVKIRLGNKFYGLDSDIFKEKYRYVLFALTGMKGQSKTGATKSIGGILNMMNG